MTQIECIIKYVCVCVLWNELMIDNVNIIMIQGIHHFHIHTTDEQHVNLKHMLQFMKILNII